MESAVAVRAHSFCHVCLVSAVRTYKQIGILNLRFEKHIVKEVYSVGIENVSLQMCIVDNMAAAWVDNSLQLDEKRPCKLQQKETISCAIWSRAARCSSGSTRVRSCGRWATENDEHGGATNTASNSPA
eukprot:5057785-Pleurochrysis_carterae.AAC.1